MNRETLETRMLDYLYDEMSPEEREQYEHALAEHPDLRREIEELQAVRNVARAVPDVPMPRHVVDNVMAEARRHAALRTPALPTERTPGWLATIGSFFLRPATGAAFVFLLVLGTGVVVVMRSSDQAAPTRVEPTLHPGGPAALADKAVEEAPAAPTAATAVPEPEPAAPKDLPLANPVATGAAKEREGRDFEDGLAAKGDFDANRSLGAGRGGLALDRKADSTLREKAAGVEQARGREQTVARTATSSSAAGASSGERSSDRATRRRERPKKLAKVAPKKAESAKPDDDGATRGWATVVDEAAETPDATRRDMQVQTVAPRGTLDDTRVADGDEEEAPARTRPAAEEGRPEGGAGSVATYFQRPAAPAEPQAPAPSPKPGEKAEAPARELAEADRAYESGRYGEAITRYNTVLGGALAPDTEAEARLNLARSYSAEQQLDLALTNYRDVLHRHPGHRHRTAILFETAVLELRLGHLDAAERSLKRLESDATYGDRARGLLAEISAKRTALERKGGSGGGGGGGDTERAGPARKATRKARKASSESTPAADRVQTEPAQKSPAEGL